MGLLGWRQAKGDPRQITQRGAVCDTYSLRDLLAGCPALPAHSSQHPGGAFGSGTQTSFANPRAGRRPCLSLVSPSLTNPGVNHLLLVQDNSHFRKTPGPSRRQQGNLQRRIPGRTQAVKGNPSPENASDQISGLRQGSARPPGWSESVGSLPPLTPVSPAKPQSPRPAQNLKAEPEKHF